MDRVNFNLSGGSALRRPTERDIDHFIEELKSRVTDAPAPSLSSNFSNASLFDSRAKVTLSEEGALVKTVVIGDGLGLRRTVFADTHMEDTDLRVTLLGRPRQSQPNSSGWREPNESWWKAPSRDLDMRSDLRNDDRREMESLVPTESHRGLGSTDNRLNMVQYPDIYYKSVTAPLRARTDPKPAVEKMKMDYDQEMSRKRGRSPIWEKERVRARSRSRSRGDRSAERSGAFLLTGDPDRIPTPPPPPCLSDGPVRSVRKPPRDESRFSDRYHQSRGEPKSSARSHQSRDEPRLSVRDPMPREEPKFPSRYSPREEPKFPSRYSPREEPKFPSRYSPREEPKFPSRHSPREEPKSSAYSHQPRDEPRLSIRDPIPREEPNLSIRNPPLRQEPRTNPFAVLLENKNVSLSSLLEAAMQPTGHKAPVVDPAVKRKVLSDCEAKISQLYRHRIAGRGSFFPDPVPSATYLADNSSPLSLNHPQLEFNTKPVPELWTSPEVVINMDNVEVVDTESPELSRGDKSPAMMAEEYSNKPVPIEEESRSIEVRCRATNRTESKTVESAGNKPSVPVETVPSTEVQTEAKQWQSDNYVMDYGYQYSYDNAGPVQSYPQNDPAYWQQSLQEYNPTVSYPGYQAPAPVAPVPYNPYPAPVYPAPVSYSFSIPPNEPHIPRKNVIAPNPSKKLSTGVNPQGSRNLLVCLPPTPSTAKPPSPQPDPTILPPEVTQEFENNFRWILSTASVIRGMQRADRDLKGIMDKCVQNPAKWSDQYLMKHNVLCRVVREPTLAIRVVCPPNYINLMRKIHTTYHDYTDSEIMHVASAIFYRPPMKVTPLFLKTLRKGCQQCKPPERDRSRSPIHKRKRDRRARSRERDQEKKASANTAQLNLAPQPKDPPKQRLEISQDETVQLEPANQGHGKTLNSQPSEKITKNTNFPDQTNPPPAEIKRAELSSMSQPISVQSRNLIQGRQSMNNLIILETSQKADKPPEAAELSHLRVPETNEEKGKSSNQTEQPPEAAELTNSKDTDSGKCQNKVEVVETVPKELEQAAQEKIVNLPAVIAPEVKQPQFSNQKIDEKTQCPKPVEPATIDFKVRVRNAQMANPELCSILTKLESNDEHADRSYTIKAGMLCRKCKNGDQTEVKIVVTPVDLDVLVEVVHTMHTAHTPLQKTLQMFNKHFTPISGSESAIKRVVENCSHCAQFKNV